MESRDSIDLMDHSSNMEIDSYWYQKGTNNKCTYDLTDHLMVDLQTIITLASITYIVDLDTYELYLGDEKVLIDFTYKC